MTDIDKLWDFNDPAGSESRFRALLPTDHPAQHAEILTQIARALGLQGKFDAAHAILDEAESMLTDAMPRVRVRCLLERGRAFNSSGQPEKARPFFEEAWELGVKSGQDALAVDAAHMVAIVESDAETSLQWNQAALLLAAKSDEPRTRKWRGSLHNNIGWTYHDAGGYDTALMHFQKALEARQEEQNNELIRVARWCIARTLRSLGRVEEALAMQQAQLAEYEAIGEEPGYTFEELGECLLALGRESEAAPFFARAYDVLSQDAWLVKNEAERLERLKNLSDDAAQ